MGDVVPPDLVDFNQMAEQRKAAEDAAKPAALDAKLDGDNIPEALKGKTVAEVLAQHGALAGALKTSEQARQEITTRFDNVTANISEPKPAARPEPKQPEVMSEEDLQKLYEENPLKAIQIMTQQSNQAVIANVEQRIGGLAQSTVATVESNARERHKGAFDMFGDQIQAAVDRLGNKAAMATPQAWDDMVAFISGQPQNMKRLIANAQQGDPKDPKAAAQEAQAAAAAANLSGGMRTTVTPPAGGGEGIQDPYAAEIADGLIASGIFKSREEYAEWAK